MTKRPTDCRSPEGEAEGLVDALIVIMRHVSRLDFSIPEVQEALKDLYSDEATMRVLGPLLDRVRRSEIAAGRNRLNQRADARFGRDGRMWHGGPFRFRTEIDTPDLAISMSRIK